MNHLAANIGAMARMCCVGGGNWVGERLEINVHPPTDFVPCLADVPKLIRAR